MKRQLHSSVPSASNNFPNQLHTFRGRIRIRITVGGGRWGRDRAFYGQHEQAHTESYAVGVVVATPGVSLAPGAPWLVARKILCVLCARLLQNENCYSTESEAEQAAKHSRRVEWQRQRRRRRGR